MKGWTISIVCPLTEFFKLILHSLKTRKYWVKNLLNNCKCHTKHTIESRWYCCWEEGAKYWQESIDRSGLTLVVHLESNADFIALWDCLVLSALQSLLLLFWFYNLGNMLIPGHSKLLLVVKCCYLVLDYLSRIYLLAIWRLNLWPHNCKTVFINRLSKGKSVRQYRDNIMMSYQQCRVNVSFYYVNKRTYLYCNMVSQFGGQSV